MTVGGCIVRLDLGGGCENNMEMNDLVNASTVRKIIDAITRLLKHGFGDVTIKVRDHHINGIKITFTEDAS